MLFIGGYARSGSTMLGRVLGLLDGFLSVGELSPIWERGLAENQLCGCGRQFRLCTFWNAVFDDAFSGMALIDAKQICRLSRRLSAWWRIPLIQGHARRGMLPDELQFYVDSMRRLLWSIKRVAGCKVIVDSSKIASHGLILELAGPTLDLSWIQLVRDPRATAYSLKWRAKYDPSIGRPLPQQSVIRTSLAWMVSNVLAGEIGRKTGRYQLIRYEDFVRSPSMVIAQILKTVDEPSLNPPFQGNRTVSFGLDHTVSGNPVRFNQGDVTIAPDIEWRSQMSDVAQGLVSALTWPASHWLDAVASEG